MPTEDDVARKEGELLRAVVGSLRLSACAAWRSNMMDGCQLCYEARCVVDVDSKCNKAFRGVIIEDLEAKPFPQFHNGSPG